MPISDRHALPDNPDFSCRIPDIRTGIPALPDIRPNPNYIQDMFAEDIVYYNDLAHEIQTDSTGSVRF